MLTIETMTALDTVGAFDPATIRDLATLSDTEARALGLQMSTQDYPGMDRPAAMLRARDAARLWVEAHTDEVQP